MKEIIIKGKNSENIIRLTCYHCSCIFDLTLDEFDKNQKTTCPQCGTKLSMWSSFK